MPRTLPNYCCLLLSILAAGCDPPDSPEVPEDTVYEDTEYESAPPEISAPTEADLQQLDEQRALVESYLADDNSRANYQTAAGKLGTIRAILAADVFAPEQTHELESLGVVLGDAFVQELGMEWIIVDDEYGRTAAVRLPETSIILFPLTMISKRIENGEKVDVFELYNGVVDQVEQLMSDGEYDTPSAG